MKMGLFWEIRIACSIIRMVSDLPYMRQCTESLADLRGGFVHRLEAQQDDSEARLLTVVSLGQGRRHSMKASWVDDADRYVDPAWTRHRGTVRTMAERLKPP